MGSLKLCDTETMGAKQIIYIIRSGLVYQELGNIYHRQYRASDISNSRKKTLLNLCRMYYDKSTKVFQAIRSHSVEFINVQADRLSFQSTLIEGLLHLNHR